MEFNLIEDIYNVTGNILKIYNTLCELEINTEKESMKFYRLTIELKKCLNLEEELYFNIKTSIKYEEYIHYLEDKYLSNDELDRIKNKLSMKYVKRYGIDFDSGVLTKELRTKLKKQNIGYNMYSLLEQDMCNLFLHYLNDNKSLKPEDKVYMKYSIIYNYGLIDGFMIDNNYDIPKIPILMSDPVFRMFFNNEQLYEFIKSQYISANISEYINILYSSEEDYNYNYNLNMIKAFIAIDENYNISNLINNIKLSFGNKSKKTNKLILELKQLNPQDIEVYSCDHIIDLSCITDSIMRIYINILELEYSNKKEEEYSSLLESLKEQIKEEQKVIKSITLDELKYYSALLKSEYVPNKDDIRIQRLINKLKQESRKRILLLRKNKPKIQEKNASMIKMDEDMDNYLVTLYKLEDSIYSDIYILYTKFLEEYKDIKQLGNYLLISNGDSINYYIEKIKYELSFGNYEIENELIANNFNNNNNDKLYLKSNFVSTVLGIKKDKLLEVEQKIVSGQIEEYFNSILSVSDDDYTNNIDYIYTVITSLAYIRALLVFVSDEEISLLWQKLAQIENKKNKISRELLLDVFNNSRIDKKIPYSISLIRKR